MLNTNKLLNKKTNIMSELNYFFNDIYNINYEIKFLNNFVIDF